MISLHSFGLILGVLIATASPAPPPDPDRTQSPRTLRAEAQSFLESGDHAAALDRYGELRHLMPDAPEIPYNMGVAAYRAGDYGSAAQFFREASALATEPGLRGDAAYNLGTSSAEAVLQQMMQPDSAAEDLGNATESLQEVLQHFREALDADSANMDAKINAELTWQQLQLLEQLQQAMEQMQQDQQQSQEQQDQNEQQQQQQESQQSEQQQQGQSEQSDDQQEQQDTAQAQQQSESPDSETGQDSEEQQAQSMSQAEDEPDDQQEQREGRAGKRMTREEAERLLQQVRDRERERQQELAQQRKRRQPRVEKDW